MRFYDKIIRKYIKFCRYFIEIGARQYLRKNKDLNQLIYELNKESGSVGLSNFEYVRLYQMVRNVKPEYALECGTGKSTFIIAHAMSKNGNGKKLVTMEESEEWTIKQREIMSHIYNHKKANNWFPGKTKNLIELVSSSVTVARHRIWSGSCYQKTGDYHYSFIMVDGPRLTDENFINMDLINVLKTTDNSINIWIDGRWPTVVMCRALFGDKVISKIGWTHTEIYGATQADVFSDRKMIRKEMFKMAKRI